MAARTRQFAWLLLVAVSYQRNALITAQMDMDVDNMDEAEYAKMMEDMPKRSGAKMLNNLELRAFESCTPEHLHLLAGSIGDMYCGRPRPTLMYLDPPAGFHYLFPAIVTVNQCGGWCGPNILSCAPTETRLKEIRVQKKNHQTGAVQCGVALIQEAVACGCSCTTTADQCHPDTQTYHPEMCRCVCRDEEAKERCENDNRFWDRDQCRCFCPDRQPCSSGYVWVEELCDCLRLMTRETVLLAGPAGK